MLATSLALIIRAREAKHRTSVLQGSLLGVQSPCRRLHNITRNLQSTFGSVLRRAALSRGCFGGPMPEKQDRDRSPPSRGGFIDSCNL